MYMFSRLQSAALAITAFLDFKCFVMLETRRVAMTANSPTLYRE